MLIWGANRSGVSERAGPSSLTCCPAGLPCPPPPGRGVEDSRQRAGASSLLSKQSLSPSHFQRSWMQRLLAQANSPGWHWGGGT